MVSAKGFYCSYFLLIKMYRGTFMYNEDTRELIVAEMGDDRYECPMCLDYVSPDEKCSCGSWSEDEINDFIKFYDSISEIKNV
jgi:hypothetical protein